MKISNNRGTVSVEAAVALPVFLFTMLFFINVFEIYTVKAAVYEGCIETAEYMAEYAYLVDSLGEEGVDNSVTCLPVAAIRFREYVDEENLLDKYVVGGKNGISFLGSSFPDEKGFIDLRVNYFIHVNIPLLGKMSHMCSEHIRQRAYLGYLGDEKGTDDEDDPYVYVAQNGMVYHTTRGCTYLLPDIHSKSLDSAKKTGYKPCKYCGDLCKDKVFITPEGDAYHSDRYCSRLRRSVERKRLSEVNLPPCSKCGGE